MHDRAAPVQLHNRDGPGAPAAPRRLAEDDLYRITVPRAPRLSPDGRFILCLLERADRVADRLVRRLHLLTRETGAGVDVEAAGDVLFACWRSDAEIVVVARGDADEAVVRRIGIGGHGRDVARLPAHPSAIALSRQDVLALTMCVPKPRAGVLYVEDDFWRLDGVGALSGPEHVFQLDLETGALTQRTFGDNAPSLHRGLDWSPDGAALYFAANRHADAAARPLDTEIYRLDRAPGDLRPLTDRFGPDFDPRVSPCGEWIAYRGFDDRGGFHHVTALFLMRRDGSEARCLADVGQDIGAHVWDRSGDGIWFSYVRAGRQHLAHVDLAGRVEAIASGLAAGEGLDAEPCISGLAEFDAGADGVVAVLSDPGDPGFLAFVRPGGITPLARFNEDWLSGVALGRTLPLDTVAADGTAVQGWITLPPGHDGSALCPLILNIHGGPDLAYGDAFAFRFQRYAAEGYAVVMPNYRGSLGTDLGHYDAPWSFPGAELDDLLAAVDAAMAFGIDASRLFVTGLSAGGALTAWTIGKTDRFAAAAVHSPVINWISHALTQDLCSSYTRRMFAAMPWEDVAAWWARSPLSLAGEIETPALVIHGDADCRTPMSEGVQLYHALKLRGVPSALLLLPGAFHVPSRPSQWIEEQRFILKWFEKHGGRNAERPPQG